MKNEILSNVGNLIGYEVIEVPPEDFDDLENDNFAHDIGWPAESEAITDKTTENVLATAASSCYVGLAVKPDGSFFIFHHDVEKKSGYVTRRLAFKGETAYGFYSSGLSDVFHPSVLEYQDKFNLQPLSEHIWSAGTFSLLVQVVEKRVLLSHGVSSLIAIEQVTKLLSNVDVLDEPDDIDLDFAVELANAKAAFKQNNNEKLFRSKQGSISLDYLIAKQNIPERLIKAFALQIR